MIESGMGSRRKGRRCMSLRNRVMRVKCGRNRVEKEEMWLRKSVRHESLILFLPILQQHFSIFFVYYTRVKFCI